ncbi:hypothetical protein HDU67_005219, partial [Dinochytrium kinnereticum]
MKGDDIFGVPLFQSADRMASNSFVALTNKLLAAAGVAVDRWPRTGHCFRRGGAQFRFIDSRPRWDLDRLRWWGDWETEDVVLTYLMKKMVSVYIVDYQFLTLSLPQEEIDSSYSFATDQYPRMKGILVGDYEEDRHDKLELVSTLMVRVDAVAKDVAGLRNEFKAAMDLLTLL